jgi:CRISPR-associated protein Cmr1
MSATLATGAVAAMKTQQTTVRFLTPAFLGNAEQSGQWRTPPFKAQLRQWWRVAYAAEHDFSVNVAKMRREEGLLFGNAWLDNEFCKSLVRLRLNKWNTGALKTWTGLPTVAHPEVKVAVGSDLYLGYGPLTFNKTGTSLKANAAIQAGESATLSLAVPDDHAARIERALTLMHRYGTLGGRSRNGWGSYELKEANGTPQLEGKAPLRPWCDCLDLDWPHAIGQDEKGALIWQTKPFPDWKAVMKRLAELKIGLRTQFAFTTGKNASRPEDRHWLSYPVTNHSVAKWGNNARLPNQLRFKIRPTADGKFVGVIFHVPHLPPPDAFSPNRVAIEHVWRQVHAFLDNPAQKLKRIPE